MTTPPPSFDQHRLDVAPDVRAIALSPNGEVAMLVRDGKTELYLRTPGRVLRTVDGIGVGRPDDTGAATYLEPVTPTQFRLRTTTDDRDRGRFELSPEHWNVECSATRPTGVVIALRSRNQRAVVTLADGAAPVVVLRTADANLVGAGAVAASDGARVYLATATETAITVEALRGDDLSTLWTTALAPPPPPEPAPGSPRPVDDPLPPGRDLPWGYDPAVRLALSGDGSRLAAIVGPPVGRGLGDPQWVISLDTASGRAGPTRRSTELGLTKGGIASAAPALGASVVLVHVTTYRAGGADELSRRFDGLSRLDLAADARAESWLAPVGGAPPNAVATAANQIVLAP